MSDSETPSPLISDFQIENEASDTTGPFLVVEWLADPAPIRQTAPPVGGTLGEEGEVLGGKTRGARGAHPAYHTIASFSDGGDLEKARTKIWTRSDQWKGLAHSGIERVCEARRLETIGDAEEWSVGRLW